MAATDADSEAHGGSDALRGALKIEADLFTCDRCLQQVSGYDGQDGTSGFYRTTQPPWDKYVTPGEALICDDCMWKDERYLADYPHMRQHTNQQ